MYNLFFELIRVSLGTQKGLSRVPSADEWEELYELARAQTLRGICSRGLQILYKDARYAGSMTDTLFLKWIGFANVIMEKNRIINKQCVLLKKHFTKVGFDSSILKGQGLAAIYCKDDVDLRLLRQCGDIDVFVGGGREKVQKHINQLFEGCEFDYKNVHAPFFDDSRVEVHWSPEILMNLFRNRKLQKLWKDHEQDLCSGSVELPEGLDTIRVPSLSINRFYILLHCYRHLFESGVGLRQVMDLYFVFQQECDDNGKAETMRLVQEYRMTKFTAALMWVMQEIFHLSEEKLLCAPNEKEGRFLLDDIMQSGNFGEYDKRIKSIGSTMKTKYLMKNLQRGCHLILHYPKEVLWAPVWMVYHYVWKRFLIH